MKRILRINKYKNVGIEDKVDVILNSNFKEGSAGELVILVGENNSGKSNVLKALSDINQGILHEDAITTLAFDEDSQNPNVTLICCEDKFDYQRYVDLKGTKISFNNKEVLYSDNIIG
ncbi:MAG: ABC transporter ATP-binding protein, partial [Peptostreptococcaceae bacterium]